MTLAGFSEVQRIGSGGLGTVYSAIKLTTGGRVALKVIEDTSDKTGLIRRVQRELQALLALKGHPHVVSVEDVLDSDGKPVFVMEFAPGGSLSAFVERVGRQLTIEEVLLVGCHIGAALVDAHEAGIIHRDIKPQNALIGSFGQIKLCDFGIAALKQTDDFRSRTAALSLRYASPEELDNDPDVSYPADVFSLGATLVHLWSGLEPSSWRRRPLGIDKSPAHVALDELLRRCQLRNSSDRPAINELLELFASISALAGSRVSRLSESLVVHDSEFKVESHGGYRGGRGGDRTAIRRSVKAIDLTVVRQHPELPDITDAPHEWWTSDSKSPEEWQ
jgi:serine/threonine protein kinase